MKKLIIFCIGIIICLPHYSQEIKSPEGYLIKGNIDGAYQGKVYLLKENRLRGTKTIVDSCEVNNGQYTFQGPSVSHSVICYIKSEDGQLTPFFLENGKISISSPANNFLKAEVSGTINNNIFKLYQQLYRHVLDSLKLATVIDWQQHGKADQETEKRRYLERSNLTTNRKLEIQRHFLKQYGDQVFAPFILLFEAGYNLPIAELKAWRAQISPELKAHPYTIALDEFIKAQDFGVGSIAYHFQLPALHGGKISLKDYRGKYVLLDFWASWCGPCRGEIPFIAELHKKYKNNKLQIIGISMDTDEKAWKNAVKEMKINWLQVRDTLESNVALKYNVITIPRTVLVDPNGKVVALDLRGKDLTEKIEEILKNK